MKFDFIGSVVAQVLKRLTQNNIIKLVRILIRKKNPRIIVS